MTSEPVYYLDSNAVIAIVERPVPFTPAQERFLKGIDNGSVRAVSREIALLECLVKPLRDGDQPLTQAVLRFFRDDRTLPLMPIDRSMAIRATEFRAYQRLALPDALHVACAVEAGCTVFLSADRRLRVPEGMVRLGFDELTLP